MTVTSLLPTPEKKTPRDLDQQERKQGNRGRCYPCSTEARKEKHRIIRTPTGHMHDRHIQDHSRGGDRSKTPFDRRNPIITSSSMSAPHRNAAPTPTRPPALGFRQRPPRNETTRRHAGGQHTRRAIRPPARQHSALSTPVCH